MEDTPIEIWKLIALYLKPGIMAIVSKAFDIYDETWYRDYLLMRYDETEIVDRAFSFKELCRRSLSEGLLYTYDECTMMKTNLGINAIYAIPQCYIFVEHYILKFNGDLIAVDNDNMASNIIDRDVIYLDIDCYVKKTELYFRNFDEFEKITFLPTDTPIMGIQFICTDHLLSLCQFYTFDAIYFNYNDISDTIEIQKFDIKYKIIKTYTRMLNNNKYITYILTTNRTLLIYFNKNFIVDPVIINNVDDIGINYLYIDNKYYYTGNTDLNFCDFNINNFVCVTNDIKTDLETSNSYAILITNNKMMCIDSDGVILTSFVTDTKIKKIFGSKYFIYLIEY